MPFHQNGRSGEVAPRHINKGSDLSSVKVSGEISLLRTLPVATIFIDFRYLPQLTPCWGISTHAKYDRLLGDAANSPVVRRLGSRNQLHGGIGVSYTFWKAVTY